MTTATLDVIVEIVVLALGIVESDDPAALDEVETAGVGEEGLELVAEFSELLMGEESVAEAVVLEEVKTLILILETDVEEEGGEEVVDVAETKVMVEGGAIGVEEVLVAP